MDEFDKIFGISNTNNSDEFDKMFGVVTPPTPIPARTVGSTLKDLAISAGRGALEIPGMVTGLADLPIALTTGTRPLEAATNYIGEKTGIQPHKWADNLAESYSPNQKQSAEEINKVWQDPNTNALDVAKVYITNPGYVANQVVESIPSMVAGGVVSKGIMGAGKIATAALPAIEGTVERQVAEKGAGLLERKLAERAIAKLGPNASQEAIIAAEQNAYKTAVALAGGAGEGIVQAGQAMDQSKGEDQRKNAISALGSGLIDAIIGAGAGRVAQHFGLETAETAMAKSFNDRVETEVKNGITKYGKAGKMLGGAVSEGILQELPQSAQEQVFQNYADGKPLWEGVNRSAVEGLVTGFVMGAGANVIGPKESNIKTPQDIELDRRAGNILSQDKDQIDKSIEKLTGDINSNNELINDVEKLDQKSRELNIAPSELIKKVVADNKDSQSLLDKINSKINTQEKPKESTDNLSPEEKAVKDIEDKLNAQRFENAQKINDALNSIKEKESALIKQYNNEQDPDKKGLIADQVFNIRKEKNNLLDKQVQLQEPKKDFMSYSTREDRQKGLEETFGTLNVGQTGNEKSAAESAQVFQNNLDKIDSIQQRINQEKDIQKKQDLQNLYNNLFQNFEKDAKSSADIYTKELGPVNLVKQTMDQMVQESDPKIRQKLYDQMFGAFGVKDAQESAQVFIDNNFTEKEKGIVEDYWNSVKKELNARNEEITPGTEAFLRKRFFDTKLNEIENNVKQDAKATNEDNKKIVPSLAEQNKRQQWFKQIATELGDYAKTNPQAITPEVPRGLPGSLQSSFNNEQQVYEDLQSNQTIDNNQTLAKQETSLGNVLNQVKSAEGLTGKLANFLSDFIPESKLDIKVVIDPAVKNAKYVGGKVNTITLRDPSQLNSSLHEITHAVTAREMKANPAIREQVILLMKRVENKAVREALITPAQLELLRTAKTSQEYKNNISTEFKYGNIAYGLLNENEFLAQAMGNEQFQILLKATTIADKGKLRNAWDAFVEIVMKALGIKEANKNAFGEALSIIAKLASQENVVGNVESGKTYDHQVDGQTIKTVVLMEQQNANKWYSALENAVNGFKQKIGTPEQWKGMIKGYPGIKQEELDWIGLDEWLDSKEGKVSKNELVKFIQKNNVQLEEVIHGDKKYLYTSVDDWDNAIDNAETEEERNRLIALEDEWASRNFNQQTDSRYDQYQLPGGKNYKELLITLPKKQTSIEQDAQEMFGKYFMDLSESEFRQLEKSNNQKALGYKSSHWNEPNILSHIRFNERTDAEGNKVLFLEEVQSDWHQEGRKDGYQGSTEAYDKIKSFADQHGITIRTKAAEPLPVKERHFLLKAAENTIGKDKMEELLKAHYKELEMKVPNAPFKKSWPLLAMKRMVRYAAENGFDKIAWTTGEQQANRYNLSNQVDKIGVRRRGGKNANTYDIYAYKNDEILFDKSTVSSQDLPALVGRELAEKIINDEQLQHPGNVTDYSGLDLQVGSEGMKGFYDQMLPSMLNKEFNRGKWGNAKVEPIQIGENKTKYFVARNGDPMYGYDTLTEAGNSMEELQKRDPDHTYGISRVQNNDAITTLSIPITNRMKSKALSEGMPMFEVREEPVQKISDDTYNKMFAERNNLVRTIGQTLRMRGHEIKQLIDKGLGSISTRLKNVDPMLQAEIRNLDFRTSQNIVRALRIAHPLLEKTKQMSSEDKFIWDTARRNSDDVKIKQIAEKYGMTADQENLRSVLDKIRQDAIDVGYDVGFIDEYWPRVIKDQEGFLQATKGISQRPVITDAIKKSADKLGMSVEEFENTYPEQAADIASNTILGRNLGIGGPGNIQARQYETVPPELNKFYMDSDAALMHYIYSMTKKIEVRRFFGRVPERIANLKTEKKRKNGMLADYNEQLKTVGNDAQETAKINARIEDISSDLVRIEQELDKYKLQRDYTENIGTYINDLRLSGRIQADEEKVVRDILDARFHEHGTTGSINAFKNMAYIDVMGSPISALTQIGDLAQAMYVGKVWTPKGFSNTVKNIINATTNRSEITKEDLGIERIAQEFADGTTLSKAVNWVFKKVLLEKIDSICKEALINNALDNYRSMASTENGRKELLKQINHIFGTQSESVINDLLAKNPTDNVKLLLYHRLLDFQPVALSEMPEQYLKSGNGRVFYMLKTYTLKQFDMLRTEAWHKIKSGERDQVIEGIGNMIKLVSLLTLANAGADELKDWMLGKESKFSDHVIENFLTIGGASKYIRMQTAKEGLGSGLSGQIMPPFRFVNSISKDLNEDYNKFIAGDTINFDHARIIESIPGLGKLYYWHYGRGEDYKKSINEQEFNKIGKDVNLFKKQLANSTDKRTFLNANLDKFKQMKLYENFHNSLNRNQAIVNKLKKIEQTTNVRERLGQLQQQREVILNKYFEVVNSMQ